MTPIPRVFDLDVALALQRKAAAEADPAMARVVAEDFLLRALVVMGYPKTSAAWDELLASWRAADVSNRQGGSHARRLSRRLQPAAPSRADVEAFLDNVGPSLGWEKEES